MTQLTTTSLGWAAATDQGRRRRNNEDAWGAVALGAAVGPLASEPASWPDHGALLMVSDGMGGALAGEVASRFCVDRLAAELHARLGIANRSQAMEEAFHAVHRALTLAGDDEPARTGMGATLSAIWLAADGTAIIGHVGDSRIYRLRGERWIQLTEDHSVGAGMVRRGELEPDAVTRLRFHSLLEQVMGGDGSEIEPQVIAGDWRAGDVWLICSDGLHGPLGDDVGGVAAEALRVPRLADGARALVDAANEAGGPDNITVIVARFVPKPVA